nr:transcriptional regulator protein [uncultured bacterium]
MKSATIKDVAKDAGVSIKTVSRVINGEPHVTAKTREKVLTAVGALDFKINAAARALRSKAAKRLVLALDNPSQSYSEAVQINAVLACQPFSFQLSLQGRPDTEALKASMRDGDLVGVVLTPPLSNDVKLLDALEQAGVPFVRVGAERGSAAGDKIGIDDRAAAREMTEYLLALGHRRIGFITGDANYDITRRRLLGYVDGLEGAGLARDDSLIGDGDFSYASGLSCAETLLTSSHPPTAIFASNDDMAAGCLASAYKLGIRVPDSLSVVGFDDAPFSRIIYPALTTMHQSIEKMMEEAVATLAARRSDPLAPLRDAVVPHNLVKRESSAPPMRPPA